MAGKLSPRQKMINLMYLVFIAMLALNMSKEVLSAFGLMNKKLTAANQATTERNNAFLEGLNAKVSDQPEKYGPLQDKATKINDISNQLENYLEGLKTKMKKKVKDTTDYEVMDKPDYLDQLFFRGDKLKPGGKDFLDRINAYRNEMVAILGEDYKEIANSVNANFETETATNRKGKEVEWINYHFEGFPLIASLTKLTQMQTDIKTTKSEVLSAMLEGQLTSDVSLSNYEAIVIPDKTAFFSNENFKGRVVLGRFDNTLSFENVIVNGRKITDLERGQVPSNFPAGNVGTNDIKGELQYMENGELKSIKIETKYAVIPKPNEAIISADKMNVVYRGVQNPMSISIPGIAKINASAQGTLKAASGAGKYTINVTAFKGREIKINASGRLPDGKSVSFN
ncbi:MAG: gliding motility protein GldM, partial [Flavobacteriaceae bacterium]|nr:gliding motility protein GldM [Flavobacteriaceae bacterium]